MSSKDKKRDWEAFERRPYGLTVTEENGTVSEKDVTVLHSAWVPKRSIIIVPNRKKGALWWNAAHSYFKNNVEFFICNICGRDLKLSGSASAISAHLGHKHPEIKSLLEEVDRKKKKNSGITDATSAVALQEYAEKKKQKTKQERGLLTLQHGSKAQSKTRKNPSFEAQKQAQVRQIIADGLPLWHAESRWHRNLIETTVTAAKGGVALEDLVLSNRDMEARLSQTGKDLRAYLKERIMDKVVCCSMEYMPLQNGQMYTCVSAHWVEDFRLSSAVISANLASDETAASELSTVLEQWDLSSKVKYIVADSESEKAIGSGMECVGCIDSSFKQVASIAFETNDDSGPVLLKKARELVDFFDGSIAATDDLMKIAEKLRIEDQATPQVLISDGDKAWWSTMLMLQRLLGLREAISIFVSRQWAKTTKEGKLPPKLSDAEWNELEKLFLALRPLRFVCQIFGSQTNKTASLIPLVVYLSYQEIERLVDDGTSDNLQVWKLMLNKLNHLFGDFPSQQYQEGNGNQGRKKCQVKLNKAILFAHALDPRFKNMSIFPEEVQETTWNAILKEMERARPDASLKPKESTLPQSTTTDSSESQKDVGKSAGSAELDSLFQLYSHEQSVKQQEQSPSEDWSQKCTMELKQYREAEGLKPDLEADVLLGWWGKSGFGHYPVLWSLAQRYLPLPATAAPAARAFDMRRGMLKQKDCLLQSDGVVNFLIENSAIIDEDFWQLRRAGVN